ncbi:MAG: hypothetical protein IJO08_04810 [Clostridia bacterium]|nr:hypothetical protein [Clostridia bacterium]
MTKTKAKVSPDVASFFINVLGEYSKAFNDNNDAEIATRTTQLNSFIDKLLKGSYDPEKENEIVLNTIRFSKYFTEVLPISSRKRLLSGTFMFQNELFDSLFKAHKSAEFAEEAKNFINFMFNSPIFPWGIDDLLAKHKIFRLVSWDEWTAVASKLKNKELTSPEAKIKVVYEADYDGYMRPTYEQSIKMLNIGRYVEEKNEKDTFNIVGRWCDTTLRGTYYVYVPVI